MAAVRDGAPFALTTNGGTLDGHLRAPVLAETARRKDSQQTPITARGHRGVIACVTTGACPGVSQAVRVTSDNAGDALPAPAGNRAPYWHLLP